MLLRVEITGPTTAAIFTMAGFGLFGKNNFKYLPIVAGVWVYLINMSLVGLMGLGYLLLVGGDINGPLGAGS